VPFLQDFSRLRVFSHYLYVFPCRDPFEIVQEKCFNAAQYALLRILADASTFTFNHVWKTAKSGSSRKNNRNPLLRSGTLPLLWTPKGQPARSERNCGAERLLSAVMTFTTEGVPSGAGFASGPFAKVRRGKGSKCVSAPFFNGSKGT